MSPSVLGLLVLLSGATTFAEAPATPASWLEARPADAAEAEIREAFAKNAFAGPPGIAEALKQVAAAHPGTKASGLAQLAAGMLLLDAGKPADALLALRHADLAKTALTDHALEALARALEASGDAAGAAASYLAAADTRPESPLVCPALFRAAEAFTKAGQGERAIEPLTRSLTACPDQEGRALLAVGQIQEARHDLRAAAEAYDRIDADCPAAAEAKEAAKRLRALRPYLPALAPDAQAARDIKRALELFDAGRYADALPAFRALRRLAGDDADLVRVRTGRCLLALRRGRESEAELTGVPASSRYAAEAAYHLARSQAARTPSLEYERVIAGFPGTPWAEDALLALANHFQKDAKTDEALPYFRRLLQAYPEGRYADRATWLVAWGDYRAGKFDEAAQALERAARLRPANYSTAGFLYWAARARHAQGQSGRARQLLQETLARYKYSYYGERAKEALAALPATAAAPPPTLARAASDPGPELVEPVRTRVLQLLLIDRLDEARDELAGMAPSATTNATIAWIEAKRGRLRPAITAMRRAHPEYVSEAGDRLPAEVWRILYPLDYSGLVQQKAAAEGLDAATVAALICQESTFNPGAVSRAGARGLMQIIPVTGRTLARSLKVPYRSQSLYDPVVSVGFGTRYLREMLDRFGGRIERALAAYNAGPHRVDAWTAAKPDVSAEEFVESIPFGETRNYVMTILGSQEQYRRIYALPAPPAPPVTTSAAGDRGGRP